MRCARGTGTVRRWSRGVLVGAFALTGLLATAPDARADDQQAVKYLIVPARQNGVKADLYHLAESVLGDGDRYPEIFALNRNRLEPGGARFTDPTAIQPGWILVLPGDAKGDAVRSGPLPQIAPAASPAGGEVPAAPASSGAASASSPSSVAPAPTRSSAQAPRGHGVLGVAVASGAVLLLVAGGILVRLRRSLKAVAANPSEETLTPVVEPVAVPDQPTSLILPDLDDWRPNGRPHA